MSFAQQLSNQTDKSITSLLSHVSLIFESLQTLEPQTKSKLNISQDSQVVTTSLANIQKNIQNLTSITTELSDCLLTQSIDLSDVLKRQKTIDYELEKGKKDLTEMDQDLQELLSSINSVVYLS
jgi:hypothetical protein